MLSTGGAQIRVCTGVLPARTGESISIWDTGCMGLNGIGVLFTAETPGGATGGIRSCTAGGHTGVEMSGGDSISIKVDGERGGVAICVVLVWVKEMLGRKSVNVNQ